MRNPDFANVRQRLGIVGNDICAGAGYFLDKTLLNRAAFSVEDLRPAKSWQSRGIAILLLPLPSKHD